MIKDFMKRLGVSRKVKEEKKEIKKVEVKPVSKPKNKVVKSKPKSQKNIVKPKKVTKTIKKTSPKKTKTKEIIKKTKKVLPSQPGKCEICKLHTKKLIVCKDCGTKFCVDCGNVEIEVCEDCMQFNKARRIDSMDELEESEFL